MGLSNKLLDAMHNSSRRHYTAPSLSRNLRTTQNMEPLFSDVRKTICTQFYKFCIMLLYRLKIHIDNDSNETAVVLYN